MNSNGFPKMVELRQSYPASQRLDFQALIGERLQQSGTLAKITPGMRIAVGVGSRGISNLKEIVQAVLTALIGAGAKPFLVPAMGSHGGATPEGQEKVLAVYGITRETMRVPLESSMETRKIGTTAGGVDVLFSVPASGADGIIVINRVKPHTDFRGNLGSGIQKMLVIGLGKHAGAAHAHRTAAHLGHETVIREFAKVILGAAPFLCGVAILEDQNHETADIQVLPSGNLCQQEEKLFQRAWSLMPSLPFDEIDLLIVDQIGKEVSGAGMDPNVIGREIMGYSTSLQPDSSIKPNIFRIFVRNLSSATNGNGIGIGLADFTTSRAVHALDLKYTYVNALTSLGLLPAKIPIYFDTDREVIEQAISSLASLTPEALRVVRIADTLHLDRMLVSEACTRRLAAGSSIAGSPREMEFGGDGNLAPW